MELICELCHIQGKVRKANYAVRINKFDWYLCYNCSEEQRVSHNGKIVKTLKSVYWNPEILKLLLTKEL